MSIKPVLEIIDWLLGKRGKVKQKHPRILVIEDNEHDRFMLLNALETLGLMADVAHNAEEATAFLRRNGYDFVFLDMRLTYMHGWQMVHVIWEVCHGCHIILMPGQIEDLAKIRNPKKPFTVLPKSSFRLKVLKELMGRFK